MNPEVFKSPKLQQAHREISERLTQKKIDDIKHDILIVEKILNSTPDTRPEPGKRITINCPSGLILCYADGLGKRSGVYKYGKIRTTAATFPIVEESYYLLQSESFIEDLAYFYQETVKVLLGERGSDLPKEDGEDDWIQEYEPPDYPVPKTRKSK